MIIRCHKQNNKTNRQCQHFNSFSRRGQGQGRVKGSSSNPHFLLKMTEYTGFISTIRTRKWRPQLGVREPSEQCLGARSIVHFRRPGCWMHLPLFLRCVSLWNNFFRYTERWTTIRPKSRRQNQGHQEISSAQPSVWAYAMDGWCSSVYHTTGDPKPRASMAGAIIGVKPPWTRRSQKKRSYNYLHVRFSMEWMKIWEDTPLDQDRFIMEPIRAAAGMRTPPFSVSFLVFVPLSSELLVFSG